MTPHDATPNHPTSSPSDEAMENADLALAALVADLPLGVIVSGPRGDVRACNRAAGALLGLTDAQPRDASVPDPARTAVHEDGTAFPTDTQPLAVALATGRPVRDIVMGIDHPARQQRVWLLVNADPQLDEAGGVRQVIATYTDITERRGFDARVAVSDRLAAMGTLAAGVAHEINNPLAYITANLAYADSELAAPETLADPSRLAELRHAILEAREGADRLRDVVTEMRRLVRGQEPRAPQADVNRVLESAAFVLASEIQTKARLIKQLRPVPPVDADEARLGQVFINLLLNAADAIPAGDPVHHTVSLSSSVDGVGWIVVEVRDTGGGIAPNLHHRIFDPFFTSKPVGRGMGLGLAICHHIITDRGGTISVESAPDRGSVFRVALPPAT